jgi:hypothetical protein
MYGPHTDSPERYRVEDVHYDEVCSDRLLDYCCVIEPPHNEGYVNQDQLQRFSVKWEHNQHTISIQYHILYSSKSYYILGSRIGLTKLTTQKVLQKIEKFYVEALSLIVQLHPLHPKRDFLASVTLSLQVPVRHLTLIGLDRPLAPLISITGKRKILTCTQYTTRAKLEPLHSTRHIHRD